MTERPPCTTCHDRPGYNRGLCTRCYREEVKRQKADGTWKPRLQRIPADARCKNHPDRPVLSLGLCEKCWSEQWRAKNRPRKKDQHRLMEFDVETMIGRCQICGPGTELVHTTKTSIGVACPKAGHVAGWRTKVGPHGLSGDDAHAFREGKACVICGSRENLVVDHCHNSQVIRGVLCNACNCGLGYFRDRTELLARAIRYLESPVYPIESIE